MAGVDNKTLRTKCSNCETEITTEVDSDVNQRKTWPLVGEADGATQVFPACTKCYNDGWRPPGYVQNAIA